jgi:hypothetical protein
MAEQRLDDDEQARAVGALEEVALAAVVADDIRLELAGRRVVLPHEGDDCLALLDERHAL